MVTKSTTHHRCVANGIKFHYAEAGEGPPVVLLHGFPETSYAWRYQIEALKTRYRLIVPDLRGYGATDKAPTGYDKRTMANDIRALMANLGIERAAIVAHDRGARVGLRLAKDHPDAVARFAATPTSPPMSTPMRNRAGCAAHSRTIGPGEKTSRRMKRIRTSNFAALPSLCGEASSWRRRWSTCSNSGAASRRTSPRCRLPRLDTSRTKSGRQRLTRRSRPSSRRDRADGGRGIHTSDAPLRTVMPETGTRRAQLAPA